MEEGTTMQKRINNTLGRMMITGDEGSWDYGFLESLQEQLTTRGSLSPRQQEILQQVEGRYSDEALKSRAGWAESWTEDQNTKFNIALQYYRKTGYYGNIVYKYLTTAGERCTGTTPSEKEYNKLVLNKYAAGVIRNIQSESKFPVGGSAVFRGGARSNKGKPCVILQHGSIEHIASHAKGAKPIQVLPIGSALPVWTEERWLKKAKKKK
jgi:hypothetical protein